MQGHFALTNGTEKNEFQRSGFSNTAQLIGELGRIGVQAYSRAPNHKSSSPNVPQKSKAIYSVLEPQEVHSENTLKMKAKDHIVKWPPAQSKPNKTASFAENLLCQVKTYQALFFVLTVTQQNWYNYPHFKVDMD